MRTALLSLLAALLVVVEPQLPAAPAPQPAPQSTLKADLAALLDGVHEIAAPGAPGTLCVFGGAGRAAPKDELPKNDDEKRDQWMVRLSKTAGKNLGPFFQAWGVPVSQAAPDEIKKLPAWMPPHFPPKK